MQILIAKYFKSTKYHTVHLNNFTDIYFVCVFISLILKRPHVETEDPLNLLHKKSFLSEKLFNNAVY